MAHLGFLGDLHAGKGLHLSPGRLAEQEAALDDGLGVLRAAGVEAIVALGDLWDKRKPTPEEVLAVVRPLRHHGDEGGCPIIGIPGNHEIGETDGATMPRAVGLTGLAEVFSQPSVRIAGDTAVCLLPWVPIHRLDLMLEQRLGRRVDRSELFKLAAEMLVEIAKDLVKVDAPRKVLGLHWSVSQTVLPSGLDVGTLHDVVLPMDDLLALGFDAIVAAHIHRPGLYGDRFAYVGPPLPLDHGRADGDHGVWIVDTTGTPARFELVPIESPPFVTWDLDDGEVDGLADDVMPPVVNPEFLVGGYVRIRYEATEEQARRIDKGALRSYVEAHGWTRCDVEDTVARAHRERGAAIDETASRVEQLGAYMAAADVDETLAAEVLERAPHYLEMAS